MLTQKSIARSSLLLAALLSFGVHAATRLVKDSDFALSNGYSSANWRVDNANQYAGQFNNGPFHPLASPTGTTTYWASEAWTGSFAAGHSFAYPGT